MVARVLHSGGHVCLAGKALDSSLTTQKNKNQNTYEETKIQGPERVWESGRSSVLLVSTDHCGKADLVHDHSSAATSRLTHVLQLGETGLYIEHTHTPTQRASALAQGRKSLWHQAQLRLNSPTLYLGQRLGFLMCKAGTHHGS